MTNRTCRPIDCKRIELDGIRYVILRESVFEQLCEHAGVSPIDSAATPEESIPGLDMDRASLAEKLIRRRRASGLSQAELARRAGIRPETLNRIERGRNTPDFATVRKLVTAMDQAERAMAADQLTEQFADQLADRASAEPNPKEGSE